MHNPVLRMIVGCVYIFIVNLLAIFIFLLLIWKIIALFRTTSSKVK